MRELFVYYRVRLADSAAVEATIRAVQDRLRARHPGLIARLLHRPEAEDGLQTWMEIYAADPAQAPMGVATHWQVSIETEAAALLPLLAGPRRTEVFIAGVS